MIIFSLLICTLTSENQDLDKSRSTSNPRKFQLLQILIFFPGLHPKKKLGCLYKPEKNPRAKPEKKDESVKFYFKRQTGIIMTKMHLSALGP